MASKWCVTPEQKRKNTAPADMPEHVEQADGSMWCPQAGWRATVEWDGAVTTCSHCGVPVTADTQEDA